MKDLVELHIFKICTSQSLNLPISAFRDAYVLTLGPNELAQHVEFIHVSTVGNF